MPLDERRTSRVEAAPDLVARARHDRAAFGELYDLYVGRVYAFCRLKCRTQEEAEDLTAQTFERALAGIARYEDRGLPFSAWLLRIAANAATDRARRQSMVEVPSDHPELAYDDDRVSRWERAFWLWTHLDSLPAEQKEVIRLRFYDDCSFQEIAARMGRSEGAVKQLQRRALRALYSSIEAEAVAGE